MTQNQNNNTDTNNFNAYGTQQTSGVALATSSELREKPSMGKMKQIYSQSMRKNNGRHKRNISTNHSKGNVGTMELPGGNPKNTRNTNSLNHSSQNQNNHHMGSYLSSYGIDDNGQIQVDVGRQQQAVAYSYE